MRTACLLALLIRGVSTAQETLEMEATLFVQNSPNSAGIYVAWIPEPLEKYCMGKTADDCARLDYCTRTTNKGYGMCKSIARLPTYPTGMRPKRLLGTTFFKVTATNPIKGMDQLQSFYHSRPKTSFERLSPDVRIRARVRLTRKAEDDDFALLEVLAVSPLPK
jgi:hypothetical protein